MAKRKRETPRQRFQRKRQEQYATWRAEHPDDTPYDHFDEQRAYYLGLVNAGLGSRPTNAPPLTYRDQHGHDRVLNANVLAAALFGIACVGEQGFSYGQLSACFRRIFNSPCHRSMASALFRELIALGLIEHVGNYSSDHHGNRYLIIHDRAEQRRRQADPALRQRPPRYRPRRPRAEPPPNPTDNDPPF